MKTKRKKTNNFTDSLKRWRKKKGWTQRQAADFLGVPYDTYRNWERAHRVPSVFTICTIQAKVSAK